MHSRKFSVLDGIRGVSAIIVVFYHLESAHPSKGAIFQSGYLAVDLFFLMSGFVIAHAYEKKLASGMTVSNFMIARGIRLYPLYLLGTIFGLFVAVAASVLARDPERLGEAFVSLPFALLAIPHLSADGFTWFPLAPTAWSLFYEILLNFAYALLLQYLSNKRLLLISIASLLVLSALIAFNRGVDGVGALRCIFGISAGVLLYRKWTDSHISISRYPIYLSLFATVFVTMLPSEEGWYLITVPFSLGIILPFIIILAVDQEPGPRFAAAMKYLGALSYPIYLLHWPILLTVRKAAPIAQLSIVQQDMLTILVTIVISAVALRFYDEPLRVLLMAQNRSKLVGR